MPLLRYLQHGLTGRGPRLQVADVVPATHPLRPWAETLPWAALVDAVDRAFTQRFPKSTTRGRPPVSTRVLLALEWLKQELGCSDVQICHRLRTDLAVMDCLWDPGGPGRWVAGTLCVARGARPVSQPSRCTINGGTPSDPGGDGDGGGVGEPRAPGGRYLSP
jgi:hypothetical protein